MILMEVLGWFSFKILLRKMKFNDLACSSLEVHGGILKRLLESYIYIYILCNMYAWVKF